MSKKINKIQVVQFPHPKNEHDYIQKELKAGEKGWNTKRHARNFMRAIGKYVANDGTLSHGDLVFWGEWEAPAKIERSDLEGKDGLPKYLIQPEKISDDMTPGQNTDPCVFGNCFKYAVCRQNATNGKRLRSLEKGAILLFGSGDEGKFFVDTVFVVKKSFGYNIKTMAKDLAGKIKDFDDYKKLVINALNSECAENTDCNGCGCAVGKNASDDDERTFYEGATFEDSESGMYSFVPAKKYENGKEGFARLALDVSDDGDFKNLCSNLTRSQSYIEIDKTPESFWDKICKETEKQGLVKAVQIDFPQ